MDCLAQSVDRADPCFAGQSIDRLRKVWFRIAQNVEQRQSMEGEVEHCEIEHSGALTVEAACCLHLSSTVFKAKMEL